MTLALADAVDARGLALTGATTVRCRTRDDVLRALADRANELARPSLVLVSAPVYALAPVEIDQLRDRRRGPIVLVMPPTEDRA